jgi:hypothetical protein
VPITFAHPVAVLPFARHLPLSALVAGSIAPDVTYYLPIPLSGNATHSVVGILCWDLLIGLALLAAFRLSAGPAAALLPISLTPTRDSRQTRPHVVLTVVAILLGAATHVIWDSFTQTAGFAVRHWDLLRISVIEPHKTYNVLGYVSSLAGTATLAYLLARRARRTTATSTWTRWAVTVVLLAAPVIGAVLAVDDPVTRVSTYDLVRHMIVGAVRATAGAWAVYAVLWHIGASRGRGGISGRVQEAGIIRPE